MRPHSLDPGLFRGLHTAEAEVHVGVLDHLAEAALQAVGLDAEAFQLLQARISVGGQALQELDPELALHAVRLRLQHLAKAGIEPRLQRPFAQQAGAEGVDGAQEGVVDVPDRGLKRGKIRMLRRQLDRHLLQSFLELLRNSAAPCG